MEMVANRPWFGAPAKGVVGIDQSLTTHDSGYVTVRVIVAN